MNLKEIEGLPGARGSDGDTGTFMIPGPTPAEDSGTAAAEETLIISSMYIKIILSG